MTEEQRDRMMLAILRAVVKPPRPYKAIAWGQSDGYVCDHCGKSKEGSDAIAHAPDCPAALLAELTKGTP